ncbi:hypothetical protein BTR14_11390 [Rhizobium rhizosphaerae]|uniref:Probable branched-chain-amino-acid aminotransferase n=1 Tax=Xaviernesmea rhizosphaerae TaxID=1672749 RepID=A0ABX3PDT6_9HYPH|nr:aminotransferase class IV family protein [Xaviernesmea rhizosphaerae]OQP86286.1 hypothetical protein BTR14_11390 [Xaviernesmea rhizosphaerae]
MSEDDFHLFETMRHEPLQGILHRRLHLARLKRSAGRLGFAGADAAEAFLSAREADLPADGPSRLRLSLKRDGSLALTHAPFVAHPPGTLWRLRIAATRADSRDRLLRHKVSRRGLYEAARAEFTPEEADEVLLLNEAGLPCEGTITSLFLDDGTGILKTPPIGNGLLAGVLRTHLICSRRARVTRLTLDELKAGRIFMGNSLRGLIPAILVG